MNIAFRVDASTSIGTGHVMRCLVLADALARQGATCRFIHRAHPGHMAEAIHQRGHEVGLLPAPQAAEMAADADEYAHWLGVTPKQDAAQTIAALSGVRPDWLVVDHYSLDAAWEGRLRPHTERLAVIDDLANRYHKVDLLLDQNYSAQGAARYDGLLPAAAIRLCGPTFALLHPAYAERQQACRPHCGQVERVLIFFGGTDPDNLTGRVLAALFAHDFAEWIVDVVVGANNPHLRELEEQAARRGRTTLHGPVPHLADLMAGSDLVIGAGGTTTWERCCLGRPSLVVSFGDNQRPACAALSADGIIAYAGHEDGVTLEALQATLTALVADPERLRQLASAGRGLVDGRGTKRVAERLMERIE